MGAYHSYALIKLCGAVGVGLVTTLIVFAVSQDFRVK
jgi:hypothetical protein